jgi:hypothetical protein
LLLHKFKQPNCTMNQYGAHSYNNEGVSTHAERTQLAVAAMNSSIPHYHAWDQDHATAGCSVADCPLGLKDCTAHKRTKATLPADLQTCAPQLSTFTSATSTRVTYARGMKTPLAGPTATSPRRSAGTIVLYAEHGHRLERNCLRNNTTLPGTYIVGS